MKKQLIDELIIALKDFILPERIQDAAMMMEMVLNDYNVDQAERALVPYEEDVTQIMIKKFLAAKIAKGCSPRTINYYKNEITKALMRIGKPYDQITADDIRYLLAMRVQSDGVSKVTANSERRALSSFYQWLQHEEILLKNPMVKVENIKETRKKKKAFTQMEVELIRNACKNAKETALVEVLLSTWVRVSEVAKIKISDIQDNRISIVGKGDKERDVFLNPRSELAVKNYLSERSDENPYLFPRAKYAGDIETMCKGSRRKKQHEWYKYPDLVDEERHTDTSTVETTVRNLGKRAGVNNVHPHRFRRTSATMALRAGMPLLQVSKLLGHEQISTTQIYLDISDQELLQAHEKYVN